MRLPRRRGMAAFYPTCSPDTRKGVDVDRRERLKVRHGPQNMCNRQAVASALEKRAGGTSLSREAREIGCSLGRERTIVVAPYDGGVPEKLVKQDGILLIRRIPSRPSYVANYRIKVLLYRRLAWLRHIIDLATLRI